MPRVFSDDVFHAALLGGNGEMAKRFLEAHGLPRGAADSIDQLASRLAGYVNSEQLSVSAAAQLLRELIEFGEKRVYVCRGNPARMRHLKADSFGASGVTNLDEVALKKLPSQPVMNYAFVSGEEIRISFTGDSHRHSRQSTCTNF